MATTSERSFPPIFGSYTQFQSSSLSTQQPESSTHLDERLKHGPAITDVATEARTAQVRLTRELLCSGEVDAVVAHGQPSAIKAGRTRAADIHHHAIRVAIRAMRDLVLGEKAQSLGVFPTFRIGGGGMQMGNYLERLADVVDHVRDGLKRRVVAVEEALDAEDGVVAAHGGVKQVRRGVPRVVADPVGVESSEDGEFGDLQFHVP